MTQDIGLCSAVENVLAHGAGAEADILKVARSLHRNEINLLLLKRAGVPCDIIDTCFLLSRCAESLVPKRVEDLRKNALARSLKIRELRALLEHGDQCNRTERCWEIRRKPVLHALDILENGARSEEAPEKQKKTSGILEKWTEFYEETEEMQHAALLGRSY